MVIWLWWWGAFSYCLSKPVQSTTVQIHTSGRRCGPRWTPEDTIGQGLYPPGTRITSCCHWTPDSGVYVDRSLQPFHCKTPRHRNNGNVLNQTSQSVIDECLHSYLWLSICLCAVYSVQCTYSYTYMYTYTYTYAYRYTYMMYIMPRSVTIIVTSTSI